MIKFGSFITKHKVSVLLIAILLGILSIWGIAVTKVNYDLSTYLPKDLESIKGLNILSEDFSSDGSIGVMKVNKMDSQDILKLKDKISKVDGVNEALWITDIIGKSVPKEILPEEVSKIFFSKDSTLLLIKFNDSTFSEKTQKAISDVRKVANKQCLLGGISAIAKDTKDLASKEMPLLITVGAVLLILLLALTTGSIMVPIIMFIEIIFGIIYNMGTNVLLSDVSSATIPLVAAIQAGIILNFSIFLYHRYQKEKENSESKEEAMSYAISKLTGVITGCAVATIAIALAMIAMNIGLSKDIAIVCTKGIVLGLITTITVFPVLILLCDKAINKLSHKALVPSFENTSNFITKHYKGLSIIFIGLFVFAFIGKQNTTVNYNLLEALPKNLESIIATNKFKQDLSMPTTHLIIVNKSTDAYKLSEMSDKLAKVEGVSKVIGDDKILGPSVNKDIIPKDIRSLYSTDKYKIIAVNSLYESGSAEINSQINKIKSIVNQYDKTAVITGEGALTKDLVQMTENGFSDAKAAAIVGIFLVVALIFGSLSIPIILIFAVEMSVFANIGVLFYARQEIPYMISIVIGLIQLAITVIYAIFITARFKEELNNGQDKFEAMRNTVQGIGKSIVVSALPFLVASAVAAVISKVPVIRTICILVASSLLISMVVMIIILPALLVACEGFISKTSLFWTKRIGKDTNFTEERL